MKQTKFFALLVGMSFAANAKVKKLLNSEASDAELAAACTTTAPYKKDADFRKLVDGIIAGKVEAEKPAPEPAKSSSTRSGEGR